MNDLNDTNDLTELSDTDLLQLVTAAWMAADERAADAYRERLAGNSAATPGPMSDRDQALIGEYWRREDEDGRRLYESRRKCPTCQGRGRVDALSPRGYWLGSVLCHVCGGGGYLQREVVTVTA